MFGAERRMVHPIDDGDVSATRGGRDQNLLCPRVNMHSSFLCRSENARTFENDVNTQLAPLQCGRISLAEISTSQLAVLITSPSWVTGAARRPWTESYSSRKAAVWISARSFTATISMSDREFLKGAQHIAANPSKSVDSNSQSQISLQSKPKLVKGS